MFSMNCKGRLFTFNEPIVMGIINITPDSFFEGSRKTSTDAVLHQAEQMLKDGATLIDIGGQSTRPKSIQITAEEEMERVLPAIETVHRQFPQQVISVDTFYSKVAREAVKAGANIINDVSAGTMDDELLSTVAELKVPYVLMHMQGKPQTM